MFKGTVNQQVFRFVLFGQYEKNRLDANCPNTLIKDKNYGWGWGEGVRWLLMLFLLSWGGKGDVVVLVSQCVEKGAHIYFYNFWREVIFFLGVVFVLWGVYVRE